MKGTLPQNTNAPARLWIGGEWTKSVRIRKSSNPSTGAVVASVREIPPGVVNVLTETGSEVARHLVATEYGWPPRPRRPRRGDGLRTSA